MTRHLLAVAALASLAVAAPVPKEAKKAATFPHAVGTKWEYIRDGDEEVVRVDQVVEVAEKDGVITFSVAVTERGGKYLHEYRLKDGELGLAATDGRRFDPPKIVARAGMKAGDEWEAKYTYRGGEADVRINETLSVGKAEEITTPAGTFTAIPVTHKPSQGATVSTYWYADGVGLVRQVRDGQKHPYQELKSFTPGKGNK